MKRKALDVVLHAHNISKKWRKFIAGATDSVTFYTPFFDFLILRLVDANIQIPRRNITVVTDFRVEVLISHPKQLTAVRKLLDQGVQVKYLPRLHAKVLLVDDRVAILGSQNFTAYARQSKEVSAGAFDLLNGTKFLRTLIGWREEAQPIDTSLVDLLVECLRSRSCQFEALVGECRRDFDEVFRQRENKRERIEKFIRNVREKAPWLSGDSIIPKELARRFVERSVWWPYHPEYGYVRAPGHAKNLYDHAVHGWAIDFGNNTFLVGRAIDRCGWHLNLCLEEASSGAIGSLDAVKAYMKYILSGAVANCDGLEYEGDYPVVDDELRFGAAIVDLTDAINFILEETGIQELFR